MGEVRTSLAVVGAGFTGLWTALLAKEADPGRDVVVLEADEVAGAASGRNGGFCSASLTHGLPNGVSRWPEEIGVLERLGAENLQGIEESVTRHGIDCSWERTGELTVATEPWQVEDLDEVHELALSYGAESTDLLRLDAAEVRAEVASPTYLGALWDRTGTAMLDPARLADGLRSACLRLGVRVFEHSCATSLDGSRPGVRVHTEYGSVLADRVVLATNAHPSLLRRARHFVVPVYDYVLVTEPLSPQQRASVGWRNRQGPADAGNQFHYYRLTDDGRILWGGYDAVYHFGNGLHPGLDQRPETFRVLALNFARTFPQLDGLRFTHAWGGAIDTCSRFAPFWGTAYQRRVSYVLGYTGLGVGASRFGAQVALDLVDGSSTEATRTRMVREKPLPFPPEPLRWAAIERTRRSIAAADRRGGRRDLWLRTLDRVGLGFDS